jgi:transcriptional regulator with XRE-family HTH domain
LASEPNDDARSRLAANVRRLKNERGFASVEALAEAARCSPNTIYVILRKGSAARIDNVEKLAVALGVDIVDLLSKSK